MFEASIRFHRSRWRLCRALRQYSLLARRTGSLGTSHTASTSSTHLSNAAKSEVSGGAAVIQDAPGVATGVVAGVVWLDQSIPSAAAATPVGASGRYRPSASERMAT